MSAHPADRIPEGVECDVANLGPQSAESSDAGRQLARVFTYSVAGSDTAKLVHVYTCNRPAPQAIPNDLFRDFQLHVPLTWQEAKTQFAVGMSTPLSIQCIVTNGAAGPYFTYLAGDGHKGGCGIPWSSVPECVTRTRELMVTSCRRASKDEHLSINEMTIIAWQSSGTRKVSASRDAAELPD